MAENVTPYRPKRVGPARNLRTPSRTSPPYDRNRDRNWILAGLAALIMIGLIAVFFIYLAHHQRPATTATVVATTPAATGFYIGTHGDSPEAHGMSHKEALKMSALNDMPFVALRPGAAWEWISSRDARKFLVDTRRMTLPVCIHDYMDPLKGVWTPAPGTPTLASRRWLVEHDHRDFCVHH